MGFEDWDAFSAGPLRIPISGKTYVIPQMSAKVGLELAAEREKPAKDQVNGIESYRPLLTDAVFEQMLQDGVPPEAMQRAALTVHTDYLVDREHAEAFWRLGNLPEALAALAAAPGKGTQRKTRTGAGSSTTARGTGSNTRTSGSTPKPRTAKPSRGVASSRSGR